MKIRNLILLLTIIISINARAYAGSYEECIIDKMKEAQSDTAAKAIAHACIEMTTPKKCNEINLKKFKTKVDLLLDCSNSLNYNECVRQICITECEKASIWSRTFGECSTEY